MANNILSNKNIDLLEGLGTPLAGGVTGPKGSIYVDRTNAIVYVSEVAGSSAGWLELISSSTVPQVGASNGLSLSFGTTGDIQLGGTLTENTVIDGSYDLTIKSHANQVFLHTGDVKGELAWAIGSTNGFINPSNPDPVYNQAFFGSLSARELITIQAGASGHGANQSTSIEINSGGIAYYQNDGSSNYFIGSIDSDGFSFVGATTGPYRVAVLGTQLLSVDRSYEMPDADGTIALTSDIDDLAYGATNGLSLTGGTTGSVKLGGTLIENTDIDINTYELTIQDSGVTNGSKLWFGNFKSSGVIVIGATTWDLGNAVDWTSEVSIRSNGINYLLGSSFSDGTSGDFSNGSFGFTSRTSGNIDGKFYYSKNQGTEIYHKSSTANIKLNVDGANVFLNTTDDKTNGIFEGNSLGDTQGTTGFSNESQLRYRMLMFNTSVGNTSVYAMPDGSTLAKRPHISPDVGSSEAYHTITGNVMAMSDTNEIKSSSFKTVIKYIGATATTVSSTIETLGEDPGLASATISIGPASDNNTRLGVYCTGVTGKTINWSCDLNVHTVTY